MKYTNYFFIFSSIFLFLIIILGSLNYFIYNKDFYYGQYEKNGVYEKISDNQTYAKEYVEDVTNNLFRYFKNADKLNYFTVEEKSHMDDVKQVFISLKIIYYAVLVLFISLFMFMYIRAKNSSEEFITYIARTTFWGGVISISFLIVLLLMSIFYFDLLFMLMHVLLFPQGNWMFPIDSLLITLFPEQFFIAITLRIFIFALFQSIIFLGIGMWLRKHLKVRKNFIK